MTNIQGPGKAVYLEGLKFQFSEPDDWAWLYRLNRGGQIINLLIKVYKKFFFGWTVEIVDFNNKTEKIIIDKDTIEERSGFLYSFSVRLENGQPLTFTQQHRVSLKRYNRWKNDKIDEQHTPYLVPESGYYPSLFFFMLGAPGNGKTCWLNALKYPDIKGRATSQHDNLFYPGEESDELVKPASTNINEIILKTFYLRRNRTIKALVFVVDLGGEINRAANVTTSEAEKEAKTAILKTIRDNAAAIFVVRSERWLLRLMTEQSKNECGADPNENIFNILQDEKKIEICYILTGVDRIKKIIEEKPEQAGKCVLTPDSPIFHNTNKSESQMYENMAIASHIMKKRDTDRNIGDDPCFAVSCGSDLLVQEEKKQDPLPLKRQKPIDYDEFYQKFIDNVGEGHFDCDDKLIKDLYEFYNNNKIYINPDQLLSLYEFYEYASEKDEDLKDILNLDFYNFYSRSKEGASQENLDTEEEDKRISNILESYKLSKISEVLKLKPEDAYNVELPLVYMLKKLIKIEDD